MSHKHNNYPEIVL